jgi:small-conductance mechanosensitive channel
MAGRIQEKIGSLLNPEQDFKRTMSLIFAGLILIVILGFFVIAFRDEKIRQTVFSSEAGMQFLTLFSLVIAIILFSITGILEGKELSALLGGLSGYILGRVTARANYGRSL